MLPEPPVLPASPEWQNTRAVLDDWFFRAHRGSLEVGSPANVVTDFGATGDGETDDTAAFEAAVAGIPDGSGLFVPPGVYVLSGLTIAKSLTLFSYGPGARLVLADGTSGNLINLTGTGTKVLIQDICLDGNFANQSAFSSNRIVYCTGDGAAAPGTNWVYMARVEFRGFNLAAVQARGDESGTTREIVFLDNCRFYESAEADNGTGYSPSCVNFGDGVEGYVVDCECDFSTFATGRGFVFVGQTELATQSFSKIWIADNVISRCGTNITTGIGAVDVYFWGQGIEISGNRFEDSVYIPIKGKANGRAVSIVFNKVFGAPAGFPLVSWNNSTDDGAEDQLQILFNQLSGASGAAAIAVNGSEDDFFVDHTKNIVVGGNQFVDCDDTQIDVQYCRDISVFDNEADGGTFGIKLQNCAGLARLGRNRLKGQSNLSIYADNNEADFDIRSDGDSVQDNSRADYCVYIEGRRGRVRALDILGAFNGFTCGNFDSLVLDGCSAEGLSGTVAFAPGVQGGATIGKLIVRNTDVLDSIATGFSVAGVTIDELFMRSNTAFDAATELDTAGATIGNSDVDDTNSWV